VTPHFNLSVTVIDAVNLRACERHNCYNFKLSCYAVLLRDSEPPPPDQGLRQALLNLLWQILLACSQATVRLQLCDVVKVFPCPHAHFYPTAGACLPAAPAVGLSVRWTCNTTRDRQSVAGFCLRRFQLSVTLLIIVKIHLIVYSAVAIILCVYFVVSLSNAAVTGWPVWCRLSVRWSCCARCGDKRRILYVP